MGDSEVVASRLRTVTVGRVVVFSAPSKYEGRIAVIVEIIDPKRVLVDGPSDKEGSRVPRHEAPLASLQLTNIIINKLPRAIRTGSLTKKWKEAEVDKKWSEGEFSKSRVQSSKRRALTDFERFKVLRLKKQVRHEERKALAKIKSSA